MSWDLAALPRGRGAIRLQIEDRLAVLSLDNPDARNAMSIGMMQDLLSAVDSLEAADIGAVLILGEGGAAFCAGGDLRDVRAHLMGADAAAGMAKTMGAALDRLSKLPAVVVAAVEGAALGGGAELLTACDWVVAGRRSQIGFVHAALGVSPGWGGGGRLVRRIGSRGALTVLSRAERHGAEEAQQLGLVDQVVESGQAESAARVWLQRILSLPPEAVTGALTQVRAWRDEPAAAAAVEQAVFKTLWGGTAHRSALAGLKAGE